MPAAEDWRATSSNLPGIEVGCAAKPQAPTTDGNEPGTLARLSSDRRPTMFQPHAYGDRTFVLREPYLLSLLARIGSKETAGTELARAVRTVYRRMLQSVLDELLPTETARVETRMAELDPRGVWEGPTFRRDVPVVICAVLRAGVVPTHACYEAACDVLPSDQVRIDYVYAARTTSSIGEVTGTRLDGSRIGGSVENALLLIPDPMGATGGTVSSVLDLYRDYGSEQALARVAMHMIAAPEAIRSTARLDPAAHLWTCRVDRGASPEHVLGTKLGAHPELESGLNEKQYILPGAGGLGEVLTNAFI